MIAEVFVLKRYLRRFLIQRNRAIRKIAEGSAEVRQKFLDRGVSDR